VLFLVAPQEEHSFVLAAERDHCCVHATSGK
jgi:hypothetical protein